jgi:hypothetical protein
VPISGFAALQVVRDNGQVQPGQRRRILSSTPRQEDLQTLRELLKAGKVTPLIDRTFPLAEVPRPSGRWCKATEAARSSSLGEAPRVTVRTDQAVRRPAHREQPGEPRPGGA